MELRRLLTMPEIEQFRAGLTSTRKSQTKFKETEASRVGEIHLRFGMVYGLYGKNSNIDCNNEPLLGGITLHSLADYGLTHPVSDLGGLVPSAVFEAAQLWSTCYEATLGLRLGLMLLAALHCARAVVSFPIVSPKNLSLLHRNFLRIGRPFEIPFVTAADGEKVWAQAMILQGAALNESVSKACARGFQSYKSHSTVRFNIGSELTILPGKLEKGKGAMQRADVLLIRKTLLAATI